MPDTTPSTHPIPAQQACLKAVLRMAGLRATRQRVALGELLFTGMHQHFNADELHQKAIAANANLSLATVYNTLHQFRQAGLLREVAVESASSYFDTDTSGHHHFFVEDDKQVLDIPPGSVSFDGIPEPPEGMEVTHIDVIVRVRKVSAGRPAAI
ncbi:iron response transcriptional regulator IrrA [Roseibium litorale]|uniref:Ferric uptake regulation protein n=1 Tax=Roseibium litorale TaxID=2803841 RepID=A0ABR9CR17_9HYPH|nr:Fur family transcriptional regulator [Roseibium litorale]MBD8893311.1 transcriptional repressor [Roseibium litorale]